MDGESIESSRLERIIVTVVVTLVLAGVGACTTHLSADTRDVGPSVFTGQLDAVTIEDFIGGRSETRYVLVGADGRRQLIALDPRAGTVLGDWYTARGELRGGVLEVSELVAQAPGRAAGRGDPNLGEQRTVVLLVNSFEHPVEPVATSYVGELVFGEANPYSVTRYFEETSYGKVWLTGQVFGWYTLQLGEGQLCNDHYALLDAAVAAADPDVYYPDYSRLMILFPDAGCEWGGLGNSGLIAFATDDGNVMMSWSQYNSIAQFGGTSSYGGSSYHELGHNFGLGHANDWECGDQVVEGDCESINYGDTFDTMGQAGAKGQFNALHKELARWFDPSQLLQTAEPGQYTIGPLETELSELKALKIPASDGLHYYVEFRRPIGFDAHVLELYPTANYDGAMIHMDRVESNGDTQLLDMSPDGLPSQLVDSLDVVLEEGRRFVIPSDDITITTVDVSDGGLVVRIDTPASLTGPGAVPPRIELERLTPTRVRIHWSASPCDVAQDYAIYEGALGSWYSHDLVTCTDEAPALREDVETSPGSRYFMVVPLSPESEGSYGQDSNGMERPVGGEACVDVQGLGCG